MHNFISLSNMEYLLEGFMNKKNKIKCEKFIQSNQQIIEDVFTNNHPIISPIKTKSKDWRMYCYSHPNTFLIVRLDKKLDKCIYKYEIDISEKQLEYITLQINFIKMKFNDFIEYLFNNAEKYKKLNMSQFSNGNKSHKLYIGISNKPTNNYFFKSENFYELVESSKIFLHKDNFKIYENQLSFCFGNELDKSIRVFFRLKFLKFYLHKYYSLLEQEYILLAGSFLLFAMGFRPSRDSDIYSLEKGDVKLLDKNRFCCDYNVNWIAKGDGDYKVWEKIFEEDYYLLFGFKTNNLDVEIKKRYARVIGMNSRKALADYLVLKYFMGDKSKVDLSEKMNVNRILYFRYHNFNRELIKNYFTKK